MGITIKQLEELQELPEFQPFKAKLLRSEEDQAVGAVSPDAAVPTAETDLQRFCAYLEKYTSLEIDLLAGALEKIPDGEVDADAGIYPDALTDILDYLYDEFQAAKADRDALDRSVIRQVNQIFSNRNLSAFRPAFEEALKDFKLPPDVYDRVALDQKVAQFELALNALGSWLKLKENLLQLQELFAAYKAMRDSSRVASGLDDTVSEITSEFPSIAIKIENILDSDDDRTVTRVSLVCGDNSLENAIIACQQATERFNRVAKAAMLRASIERVMAEDKIKEHNLQSKSFSSLEVVQFFKNRLLASLESLVPEDTILTTDLADVNILALLRAFDALIVGYEKQLETLLGIPFAELGSKEVIFSEGLQHFGLIQIMADPANDHCFAVLHDSFFPTNLTLPPVAGEIFTRSFAAFKKRANEVEAALEAIKVKVPESDQPTFLNYCRHTSPGEEFDDYLLHLGSKNQLLAPQATSGCQILNCLEGEQAKITVIGQQFAAKAESFLKAKRSAADVLALFNSLGYFHPAPSETAPQIERAQAAQRKAVFFTELAKFVGLRAGVDFAELSIEGILSKLDLTDETANQLIDFLCHFIKDDNARYEDLAVFNGVAEGVVSQIKELFRNRLKALQKSRRLNQTDRFDVQISLLREVRGKLRSRDAEQALRRAFPAIVPEVRNAAPAVALVSSENNPMLPEIIVPVGSSKEAEIQKTNTELLSLGFSSEYALKPNEHNENQGENTVIRLRDGRKITENTLRAMLYLSHKEPMTDPVKKALAKKWTALFEAFATGAVDVLRRNIFDLAVAAQSLKAEKENPYFEMRGRTRRLLDATPVAVNSALPLAIAAAALHVARENQRKVKGFSWWSRRRVLAGYEESVRQSQQNFMDALALSQDPYAKEMAAESALSVIEQPGIWRRLTSRGPKNKYDLAQFTVLLQAASPKTALQALKKYEKRNSIWPNNREGKAKRAQLIKDTINRIFAEDVQDSQSDALAFLYAERSTLFSSNNEAAQFFSDLIRKIPNPDGGVLKFIYRAYREGLFSKCPTVCMTLLINSIERVGATGKYTWTSGEPLTFFNEHFAKYPEYMLDLLINPAISDLTKHALTEYLQADDLKFRLFSDSILTGLSEKCRDNPKMALLQCAAPKVFELIEEKVAALDRRTNEAIQMGDMFTDEGRGDSVDLGGVTFHILPAAPVAAPGPFPAVNFSLLATEYLVNWLRRAMQNPAIASTCAKAENQEMIVQILMQVPDSWEQLRAHIEKAKERGGREHPCYESLLDAINIAEENAGIKLAQIYSKIEACDRKIQRLRAQVLKVPIISANGYMQDIELDMEHCAQLKAKAEEEADLLEAARIMQNSEESQEEVPDVTSATADTSQDYQGLIDLPSSFWQKTQEQETEPSLLAAEADLLLAVPTMKNAEESQGEILNVALELVANHTAQASTDLTEAGPSLSETIKDKEQWLLTVLSSPGFSAAEQMAQITAYMVHVSEHPELLTAASAKQAKKILIAAIACAAQFDFKYYTDLRNFALEDQVDPGVAQRLLEILEKSKRICEVRFKRKLEAFKQALVLYSNDVLDAQRLPLAEIERTIKNYLRLDLSYYNIFSQWITSGVLSKDIKEAFAHHLWEIRQQLYPELIKRHIPRIEAVNASVSQGLLKLKEYIEEPRSLFPHDVGHCECAIYYLAEKRSETPEEIKQLLKEMFGKGEHCEKQAAELREFIERSMGFYCDGSLRKTAESEGILCSVAAQVFNVASQDVMFQKTTVSQLSATITRLTSHLKVEKEKRELMYQGLLLKAYQIRFFLAQQNALEGNELLDRFISNEVDLVDIIDSNIKQLQANNVAAAGALQAVIQENIALIQAIQQKIVATLETKMRDALAYYYSEASSAEAGLVDPRKKITRLTDILKVCRRFMKNSRDPKPLGIHLDIIEQAQKVIAVHAYFMCQNPMPLPQKQAPAVTQEQAGVLKMVRVLQEINSFVQKNSAKPHELAAGTAENMIPSWAELSGRLGDILFSTQQPLVESSSVDMLTLVRNLRDVEKSCNLFGISMSPEFLSLLLKAQSKAESKAQSEAQFKALDAALAQCKVPAFYSSRSAQNSAPFSATTLFASVDPNQQLVEEYVTYIITTCFDKSNYQSHLANESKLVQSIIPAVLYIVDFALKHCLSGHNTASFNFYTYLGSLSGFLGTPHNISEQVSSKEIEYFIKSLQLVEKIVDANRSGSDCDCSRLLDALRPVLDKASNIKTIGGMRLSAG